MKKKAFIITLATALVLGACSGKQSETDASGTFEAVETIVSADAAGIIEQLNIEEGSELKAGQQIGYIDSTQLFLRRKQLLAQIGAVLSRKPNSDAQVAALKEQLKQAEREQQRISRLYKADAATQKQLDDANSQVAILQKQIAAQQSALQVTTGSLSEETQPIVAQIEQLNDQLRKCRLVNPVNGTVLVKYVEQYEMAAPGKPLYKIADLSSLLLNAYITGDQLPKLKLNQQVTVLVDGPNGGSETHKGTVEWISNKAEFTPKTIQTRDERANLVYAVKIRVKNNGSLKIGMYGEVNF